MCGIFGVTGARPAVPILLDGLRALEYRGYDSAGIAVYGASGVHVVKQRGRVDELMERVKQEALPGTCGIGHTRWATHGAPSDENAHPHRAGCVTLVHNGIIQNARALRADLEARGAVFLSDTDSEAAAWLLHRLFLECDHPIEAMRQAANVLSGSYAFACLFDGYPGTIFTMRSGSPLLAARAEGATYLSSDVPALLPHTRRYIELQDGDMAALSPENIAVYDVNGHAVNRAERVADWNEESARKGGYAHYMLKEMHEAPAAVETTLRACERDGLPFLDAPLLSDERLARFQRLLFIGCGTARHAGLLARDAVETLARVNASCEIASEFRDRARTLSADDLVVLISQSGETADTLGALRRARAMGACVLGVVNVPGSSIEREADAALRTLAGPEISVASTKAFHVQIALCFALALRLALARGALNADDVRTHMRALHQAPGAMNGVLERRASIGACAAWIKDAEHIFYLGRKRDDALAREGALKLKEISYIHCESCPAGEMKHGTLSLVEPGTPVVLVGTERALAAKYASACSEVMARGARVLAVAPPDVLSALPAAETIPLPDAPDLCLPFAAACALQLLAYETAVQRGRNVDKPRNLAKSVTVE